jgi:16S rRNA (cytosine1407-C5)-methyltransferase
MKRKNKRTPNQEISAEEALQQSMARFEPLLSPDEFKLLQAEVNRPLLPSIRINPLRTSSPAIDTWKAKYRWNVTPISFCEAGYWVDDSQGTPVSQTLEHRLGHYYIQEAASMLPPELFTFDSGNPGLTLDMAASPGGKTTHLIARGGDQGLVIANDSSQGRIPALRIVLQNWGAVNSAISQFPGEKFGPWFAEIFDRVLIDAPCSMQGLRTSESHGVRPVTEKESLSLAARQAALLASALQAVKIGGEVVYSTCTLLPAEDEGVVDAVLNRFGKAVEVKPVHLHGSTDLSGLPGDGAVSYQPAVANTLRLWPHRLGTAGFFACLLRKNAPLDLPAADAPSRPLEKIGFQLIGDHRKISDSLKTQYGFDLEEILESYDLLVMQRYERVIAFPRRVYEEFADLPLESAGMTIGEVTPEGLLPSHEWVSRFGDRFTTGRVELTETQCANWARGEDCFDLNANGGQKGKVVAVFSPDGLALGRGKYLKDRLKNLLPRRLI